MPPNDNLPPSAQLYPPNTFTGQTQPGMIQPQTGIYQPATGGPDPRLAAIQALSALYHPQARTDAGWGTNNSTAPQDWANMFHNTGVLGGQMQSSVQPGEHPGLMDHAAQIASTHPPMATSLFNMRTDRAENPNTTPVNNQNILAQQSGRIFSSGPGSEFEHGAPQVAQTQSASGQPHTQYPLIPDTSPTLGFDFSKLAQSFATPPPLPQPNATKIGNIRPYSAQPSMRSYLGF